MVGQLVPARVALLGSVFAGSEGRTIRRRELFFADGGKFAWRPHFRKAPMERIGVSQACGLANAAKPGLHKRILRVHTQLCELRVRALPHRGPLDRLFSFSV